MDEYKIVISISGGEGSEIVSGEDAQLKEDIKTIEGAKKAVKSMVSYAAARTFADNLISYEISQVSLRTGAQEFEQKLQFGYSMTNKVVNIATATLAGAKLGGAIGAGVGFIGSIMYTMFGYSQNENIIRTKQTLEDISIGMASLRAGVSGRRGANQ